MICDVADSKTADLILDPIRQLHIPKCTIRLNADNIVELEDVARKAVLNVTGHVPAVRDHFRFLELPTEIRQHILSFTDLVTPYQEVQFWALPDCGRYDLYDTRRREHCGCRQAFYRSYCDDFCSKHHSVYPAVCGCFLSPLPFLLVCRKMLQDSRQVFYSRNRFVLRSESSSSYPREQPAGPRGNSLGLVETYLTRSEQLPLSIHFRCHFNFESNNGSPEAECPCFAAWNMLMEECTRWKNCAVDPRTVGHAVSFARSMNGRSFPSLQYLQLPIHEAPLDAQNLHFTAPHLSQLRVSGPHYVS